MKFYSEVLDKMFDSESDCIKAEWDAKKKENDKIFEQEKAAAKKELDAEVEKLTKKTMEYFNKYEKDWAPVAEAILSRSFGQKEGRVERKAVNKTETDFTNLLESFLK